MRQQIRLATLAAVLWCAPLIAAQQTAPAQPVQTVPDAVKSNQPPPQATSASGAQALPAAEPIMECYCESQALPEVLAEVGAEKLTAKEIEEKIKDRVLDLKQQVIQTRARELYLQINTRLLEAEAKRRGKSTTALIEEEIVAKLKEPTEAEAQTFYDQNKDRIRQGFQTVKTQIIEHLRVARQRDEAKKFAARLRAAAQVVINDKDAPVPGQPLVPTLVLATVNGGPITVGDIEETLRPLIFSVQTELYKLRKQVVDVKINDLLLNREAQARKLTPEALVEAEATSKAKKMTDADALAFFEERKQEIGGEFEPQKQQLLLFLQEREGRRAEAAFAERLRAAAAPKIFLREPEPPVYKIATDDQPAKGSKAAPVTIVEFTDYQCPSCANTFPLLERLLAEYSGKVQLVVRDFPLEQHPDAFKAAEAAEAARAQGKYWEYSALLMRNQTALGVEHLKAYATQLKLDRKQFDAALDSGKFAEQVQRDMREGLKYGVAGTPAIFVNGRQVRDNTYTVLKSAVDAALKIKDIEGGK